MTELEKYELTNKLYTRLLLSLEFAEHHWRAIRALVGYKNDRMIELNQNRLKCDIDLVIETLTELKEELGIRP